MHTILSLCLLLFPTSLFAGEKAMDVLVLQDHYQSEYTWAAYQEAVYPMHHPGHHYFISGVLKWHERFGRWLDGWDVRTVDLEQLEEPLDLRGVDLVILDDVRQSVSDPYELALMEFPPI